MSNTASRGTLRGRAITYLAQSMAGVLVAGLAVVGVALPAQAATGDVSAATLDWGVKASWQSYVSTFGGTVTASDGASTSPAYHWSDQGTGSFDEATSAASVDFGGTISFTVPSHGVAITLSNPSLELSGDGTGTLAFTYVNSSGASGRTVIANLSTVGAAVSTDGGVASFSGVSATMAQGGVDIFQSYPAGTTLDPVAFSLPYELAPVVVASPTATTLAASPAGTSVAGGAVSLTATVTPSADGTVQFFDGGAAIGSPITVSGGTASTSVTSLAVGSHGLTAQFTPADPAVFEASVSDALEHTVTAAPVTPAETTSLTVATAPAAPLRLGSPVTLTATVTPASATGTVEFIDTASGRDPVSLGSAPVSQGVASLTTSALVAGGHVFAANFAAADPAAFAPSTTATTANYGVVDVSTPGSCSTGASAAQFDGVTASWNWSDYSSDWNKSATGDIAVSDETFSLSKGVASYDENCAIVEFIGSMKALAYPGMADAWVTLTDPTLALASDGSGTWSADVTTFENSVSKRLVVATISGAEFPDFTATNTATIVPDFAGTTAPGTWAVLAAAPKTAYANAWSNQFVIEVPTSIRSFYYTSSESAAQARKPASAIGLSWTAVTPEVPTTPTEEGELVWGFKQSWRSYLSMFGGTSTATGGASIGSDGLYTFGQADTGTYDPATGLGTIDYVGTVRFVSALHGFDLALANPRVTFTATGAVLSAETSTTETGGVSSLTRIDLATLSIPSGLSRMTALSAVPVSSWTAVPATFASVMSAGWEQYAGQAADPVSFSFGAVAGVPVEVPGENPGTTPGVDQPSPAVVSEPAAAQLCVASEVSGATLSWGVKESFRSYIAGPIAKGGITQNGVSLSGTDFVWGGGSGSYNRADSLGRIGYGGSVNFTGHAGKLDLTIATPSIQVNGPGSASLIVHVTSKALSGPGVDATVTLATLALPAGAVSGGAIGWSDVPATLTTAGAEAFGGFYQAGASLDPVSFSLPLGASVACDSFSDSRDAARLARTGATLDAGWLALALMMAGGVVLVAGRRIRGVRV